MNIYQFRKIAAAICITVLFQCTAWGGEILYVDIDTVGGAGDGSSWTNAFTDLQDALDVAVNDDEIWVAEGTYVPVADEDGNRTPTDPRTKTFAVNTDIYGGFIGNGPGGYETDRKQRDWENHVTVLSGDLNGDDDPTKDLTDPLRNKGENCYNVVIFPSTIDGFKICNGNANGSGGRGDLDNGGGIFGISGMTVRNCFFTGNYSIGNGSAIYNLTDFGSEEYNNFIINCTFMENSSGHYGGAYYTPYGDNVIIADCDFIENTSQYGGGAVAFVSYFGPLPSKIINCSFKFNSTNGRGGGIASFPGSNSSNYVKLIITGCDFDNNTATSGGGIFRYSEEDLAVLKVANCVFTNNSATDGGGMQCGERDYYTCGGQIELANCLFYNNSASRYGGGICNYNTSPELNNCTFYQNSAAARQGAICNKDESYPALKNTILWNNPGSITGIADDSYSLISHCNIEGCGGSGAGWASPGSTDSGGNIDTDPLFTNPGNPAGPDESFATDDDGLALQTNSPCVDTGDKSLLDYDSGDSDLDTNVFEILPIDLNGSRRVLNSQVDMGAYEYGISSPLILRVDTDVVGGAGDGSSWADAFPILQDALDVAIAGDEVWVAEGLYTPSRPIDSQVPGWENPRSNIFLVSGRMSVYGGFIGNGPGGYEPVRSQRDWGKHPTILSGDINRDDDPTHIRINTADNVYAIVSIDSQSALDGFTIRGAFNDLFEPTCHYRGAISCFQEYPAIRPTETTSRINNCFICGNQRLHDFYVPCAAALYVSNYVSLQLTNCCFTNNFGIKSSIYNLQGDTGDVEMVNCTYAYNGNSQGDDICNNGLSPVLTNCILWGGYSRIKIINESVRLPIITHSNIQGSGGSGAGWDTTLGTDLGGNIDEDPWFVDPFDPVGPDGIYATADDGLRLLWGSPCIDTGDTTELPPDTADLDGDGDTAEPLPLDLIGINRVLGSAVDMGAYEFIYYAAVDINPDTLNLKSHGRWVTAFITLPEEFLPEEIDSALITLAGVPGVRATMEDCILMVKFERSAVQAAIAAMGLVYPADVELTVSGQVGALPFTGVDTIRVIFPNGDIDGDGTVSFNDFILLRTAYGSKPGNLGWNPACDLDNSGKVDMADFMILKSNYGTTQ